MRAIVCHQLGSPELLAVADMASPVPGSGEMRVRVSAAGINFPDTLIIQGQYQLKPPLPFVPGFEVVGIVEEIGAGVTGFAIGDRVMALTAHGFGGFAEQATVRAVEAVPVPAGLDDIAAAALYSAYGTAFHGLVQRGMVRPGETLVVLGASGAVGLASVELGKALGARVIAVGRARDRLALAASKGADELICYADETFKQDILSLTGGAGADVCIDMLGGAAFDTMSRAMNWGGRLLVVGFTSGDIPRLPTNLPMLKGYSLVGTYWGRFIDRDPAGNRANFDTLAELIAAGKVAPHVDRVVPLEGVPAALRALLNREVGGKIVVAVTPQPPMKDHQ